MFWVHDTDYDRYAFMYSCENRFLFFRHEMIWVLTRERMIDFESSTYQYISGRLDMTELDRRDLVASNQTMCKMEGYDDDHV
ncbi:Apolipoprotein D [Holothuria leucospilota]|uniref:Apolipoprotein D n=1 Tax=Holothuria leucospilota TaxID=206669 RepID=A0A9Q1CAH2_HOLLE|nr:Apolipoprotein D [Holothuria leucospilota]